MKERRLKKIIPFLLLTTILLGGACDSDEGVSCDKNTSFSTNDGDQCAHARVTQYNAFNNYERFIIAVSNSTLNFELRATNEAGDLDENVEYINPGATVVAQWVNNVVFFKIKFTKIDRTNGKISGEFSFEVQSDHGTERASGRFTDVDF